MVPKKGTDVPPEDCAVVISRALRDELGASARATKTIMRWTGVSDRAAKYWLSGARCPSGRQLILLARHSDAVLHAVLKMAGRDLFTVSIELNAAQASLTRAAAIISALKER
ncbi:hypothetical protein GOE20_11480 [Sinorhizobium medicae]|nr:hypothetical protein [Sinorhizobium medicae]